jgi:hypothetical protein
VFLVHRLEEVDHPFLCDGRGVGFSACGRSFFHGVGAGKVSVTATVSDSVLYRLSYGVVDGLGSWSRSLFRRAM